MTEEMKILELFSGYGTASFALKRLGIPYELIGYSDIDKYANQCFRQNHTLHHAQPEGRVTQTEDKGGLRREGYLELGDVKLINPHDLEDFDLLTGGFPCQAFSNAGKMQGELDPRGSLFYEIIRIAEVKKPKYMLLENVKGLTCKKFKDTFSKILSELDRIGYNVYWKVLNSKDYGIPQSRARVWFVCFRKDIDNGKFQFPNPVELKIFIKDILEQEVDKKYYLSPLLQERFSKYLEDKNRIVNLQPREGKGIGGKGIISKNDGTTYCLDSGNSQGIVAHRYRTLQGLGECIEPREDGCSNTLTNVQKDNLVYDRKGFDSRTKGFRESELSPTLSTKMGTGGNNVPMIMNTITQAVGRIGHSSEELHYIENTGQLRRLTPKECFRLMGFLNDEIDFNYIEKRWFYKDKGNIKLWKQQSAKSNAVTEQPTHTNMEISALCTTKDLNELELGKNKEEILQKIENVCIAMKRLEKADAKECVINTTKCSDYTEMLYSLIKRKIELKEMDMFVELEEGQDTKSLWKITLEENLSKEKSYITSILINEIIQKKIYSYVKTESTIIANIMNYNLSEQNCLNLELSSLRMDTIKKLSDTALYKLAGNGQDVNMVTKIFKEMLRSRNDRRNM